MIEILPYVWFFIICFEITLYVVLDGADLGIGLLSLLPQSERERSLMMHVIGPIWDANETWLVVAGGTLFGAFPMVYSVVLNALYAPIMIMVFGLVIRAAAFEFHEYAERKHFWGLMFGLGSLLAVVGQGLAVGGILNGITVADGRFAGNAFDWFSPFAIIIAISVIFSYATLGYAYLVQKTSHELLHESFRNVVFVALVPLFAFLGTATLLPHAKYLFFNRLSTEPTRSLMLTIGSAIIILSLLLLNGALRKRRGKNLYYYCLGMFVLVLSGFIVGTFPYIIPPDVTIASAASPARTLIFMLYGIGPLIPIVLVYNTYLYRVFRDERDVIRSDFYR
ncbi:MAG: cytochrome d ubiquinol oxidase subunit II [Minisyncoccota bacterium]